MWSYDRQFSIVAIWVMEPNYQGANPNPSPLELGEVGAIYFISLCHSSFICKRRIIIEPTV